MIGTACAVSFAESLVEPSESLTWCHTGGDVPSLASHCRMTRDRLFFVSLTTVVTSLQFYVSKKNRCRVTCERMAAWPGLWACA